MLGGKITATNFVKITCACWFRNVDSSWLKVKYNGFVLQKRYQLEIN